MMNFSCFLLIPFEFIWNKSTLSSVKRTHTYTHKLAIFHRLLDGTKTTGQRSARDTDHVFPQGSKGIWLTLHTYVNIDAIIFFFFNHREKKIKNDSANHELYSSSEGRDSANHELYSSSEGRGYLKVGISSMPLAILLLIKTTSYMY